MLPVFRKWLGRLMTSVQLGAQLLDIRLQIDLLLFIGSKSQVVNKNNDEEFDSLYGQDARRLGGEGLNFV